MNLKSAIKNIVLFLAMISAVYFTASSMTVLELAIWIFIHTCFFTSYFIFENRKKEISYMDYIFKGIGSGLFCFIGAYVYLF